MLTSKTGALICCFFYDCDDDCEHVQRREKDHFLRKTAELPVPGKRKRGRPTQRWKDSVKKDLELRG